MPTTVCVETGSRRVFASALEWPGWCRSGRDEDEALERLREYAYRYSPVAAGAGILFSARTAGNFEVVEKVAGNATTDFGAPGAVAAFERERLTAAHAKRLCRLVEASWRALDEVAKKAPHNLRKGPRGGGRDRDAVIRHVGEAEISYARKLGIRGEQDLAAVRKAMLEVLGAATNGSPVVEKGWPTRYAARRIAWHALDHAWEIEDRS
jgi:hypothetical protein